MTLRIEKCNIDRVRELQGISRETFTETFSEQNSPESMQAYLNKAYQIPQLEKELLNPNSEFYFAYYNNELAGYLKINTNEAQSEEMGEHALEIERIYVRKKFQRLGIGQFLLDQAIEKAKERNKQAIWLGVWEQNENALAFYRRVGFTQTGSHSFFMGEEEQTDYIMTKKLEG